MGVALPPEPGWLDWFGEKIWVGVGEGTMPQVGLFNWSWVQPDPRHLLSSPQIQ